MAKMVNEIFWSGLCAERMGRMYDEEYENTKRLCEKKAASLREKIAPDLLEELEDLLGMTEECRNKEKESAFSLGCGFAFQLMMETASPWRAES